MAARIVLLMLAAMMLPARSGADVAGTGTFDILATANGGLDFDGAIAFDGGMRSVLGRQVNLARDVGTMTYDGEVLGEPSANTAIFTLEADADETDVSFVAGGSASCAAPACVGGRGTFAGRLEVSSDEEDALPDGAFTFDGTVEIDELGEGFGTFAINAFPLLTTPAGTAVEVGSGAETFVDSIVGTTRSFDARAVFSSVQLEGATSFLGLSTVSGTLPAGVVLDAAVSVFVDVQTSALLDGGLRLCLAFADDDADGVVDGTAIDVARLRLLHAAAVGGAFADVTGAPSTGEVCGEVPAPGPVVLGIAEDGGAATTTTVSAGPSTTTSTLGGGSTTTTSTVPSGSSTSTSTTVPGGGTTSTTTPAGASTTTSTVLQTSTTTTVSAPESTTTSCAPSASSTSSTTATTLAGLPSVSTTSSTLTLRSTTTSTLPVCTTALECLDLVIAGPLCPGESVNRKLASLILKKLTKAKLGLVRARTGAGGNKAGRLLTKARKQLDRIDNKAEAFASRRRKPISVECRDRIRAALARVAQQIDDQRL